MILTHIEIDFKQLSISKNRIFITINSLAFIINYIIIDKLLFFNIRIYLNIR